jgi:hypothetical protein
MTVLAKLFLLLTAIAFTAAIMVVGTARLTYHDLFAPYQALMPRHSIDGLRDYPCRFSTTRTTAPASCAFNINASFLSHVTIDASNRVIIGTTFLIRSGDVRLGDLVVCWGKPSGTILNAPPHSTPSIDIYWGEHRYAAIQLGQDATPPNEFTPVNLLSIGDQPPACGLK